MKTTKAKPPCATILGWLKANLGPRSLAPLTGTDARALFAAVQIVELYTYNRGHRGIALAFGTIVRQMQSHTQELAYHAIAHVMDWSDRASLWDLAELDPIPNPRHCCYEPSGSIWTTGEAA